MESWDSLGYRVQIRGEINNEKYTVSEIYIALYYFRIP